MNKNAVLSLSGGIDSATTLAWLLMNSYKVHAVSFYYGSKHNEYENKSAKKIAHHYNIPLIEINLAQTMKDFKSALLLTGNDIPEGHYADKSMQQTVVPARNIIFLSVLAGYAESINADSVATGIQQGYDTIYPDCRKEFLKAMDLSIYLGTDKKVQLVTPFVDADKATIVQWGLKNNVPYHLTRTCFKNQDTACGKCGSCVKRLEAFFLNGTTDPLVYEVNYVRTIF